MKTQKIIGQNIIGGDAADNGELIKKEQQAIKFLQTIAKAHQPLFLAYSGGKDSEVLLHIARKSGIEFTPVYKSTSIDKPGTIKWVESKPDVMIMRPQQTFFELIEHRGLPSNFQRFCCDKLKERFLARFIITGVRRSESWKRSQRYKEPEQCHIYHNGQRGIDFMPILFWTDKDIQQYIEKEKIKCHPIYYDEQGKFHVERRLGCIACPLRYDRGLAEFKQYPRLVRAWCRALAVYRNTRPRLTKTISYFNDEYENFYHNLFHKNLEQLEQKRSQQGGFDARKELMNIFNVDLPTAQSNLQEIKKRLSNQQHR